MRITKSKLLLREILSKPDLVTAACPQFQSEISALKKLIREGRPIPIEVVEGLFCLAGYSPANNDNWVRLRD